MTNRFAGLLPKPPAEDNRAAVADLREFAAALQEYAGEDKDVEVTVTVHPQPVPEDVAELRMSVYVPKTDYANLVLTATCEGKDGFPTTVNPYFAGGSFPNGPEVCNTPEELYGMLKRFAESPEVIGLLDYMKRHARKRSPQT